jgi:beta-lactamase regulating signal transducer with metallopeptidase domain
MNGLFLQIVKMSLSAAWLILAVLILRLVFKKAPKWINVLLWGIVAVRLICPLSIESPVSLIPDFAGSDKLVSEWTDDYIEEVSIIHDNSLDYDAAVTAGREPISDGSGGYYVITKYDQLGEPATVENTVVPVLSFIWVSGVVILLIYTVISYLKLRHKLNTAVLYQDNIYQSEHVSSPFVMGIIKPRIYLPFKLDGQNMAYVVAHEMMHIRYKDNWWKLIGFLIFMTHWFNPLVLLAYVLLCRDIELACDERVIKELNNEQRADYTQALVNCSVNHRVNRRVVSTYPLAFGELGVKERVKSVLNYKKPAFWIVIPAVVICVVVAVCFLTNPPAKEDDSSFLPGTQIDETNKLSLNDVIILSQNGYNLTWSDFEQYDFTETGSGLYIRVYEIDEDFSLWIGGGQPDKDPMYIYLALTDDSDTRIDIRDGGVTEFISEYTSASIESVEEIDFGILP